MERKFVFGVAVSGYNFTGRKAETERLLTDFRNGVNVILMSPRRLGKTSLVRHVCGLVSPTELITVYVDIFGCKTEYEFYNKLAAAVLQQTASRKELWLEEAKDFIYRLSPKISFSPDPNIQFSVSLGISPKTHTPEEILSLVEQIAERKGKRIVVCIDEFQQIGEIADSKQVQARLRSVWQHQQRTSYCLFGSKHHLMGSIFLNRSMPFYQFGDLIVLDKISTADWTDYIVTHFADGNRSISPTLAAEICTLVDNYSAYVQQLSWLVFTLTKEGDTVTGAHLQAAMNELLATNDILFMQMVEPLSEYQMNFIRAIIDGINDNFGRSQIREKYRLGSYSNINRLKKALLERDIITVKGDEITLTDPVFGKWFERKMMV